MRKQFPFATFEPAWQRHWLEQGTFRAANPGEPGSDKPKFYALDMFPYPSGAGLHVGHPEGWIATDIVSRQRRMRGYNVLHPMGWDAFGLPAEQYAVQTGTHPRETTEKNIANFRRQIQSLGFSYDWSREINTTDPAYYKWTQWIFLQLYKKGLAYISHAPVWYCPALGTVLANEEVLPTPEGPRSERGNHPVERRPLRQWMLKITAYADRLLRGPRPSRLARVAQGNAAKLDRPQRGRGGPFPSWPTPAMSSRFSPPAPIPFSARPTWSFPRNIRWSRKSPRAAQRDAVAKYKADVVNKSDLERTDLAKSKTGVFTGAQAINPVNGESIPIWIADYVLMGYGTGAIMAVPAHDERDHEFAREVRASHYRGRSSAQRCRRPILHHLVRSCPKLRLLLLARALPPSIPVSSMAFRPPRRRRRSLIGWRKRNSAPAASSTSCATGSFPVSATGASRFRSFGRVIEHEPLSESDLPLMLPELADYQPSPEGKAPLAKATEWLHLAGWPRS